MGKSYKPITSMKEVPEQLRKLRRQYLRYQQAEIIYSISHKKLLELASDAGAIYRIDGTVLINRDIFDTFSKSDFRAVKVKACEAVKKSKKLLQFTLDDGTGTDRTILSGIHAYYEPEELAGKTLIAITNLPPRAMMGIESCGMLLSAIHEEEGEEKLHLLMVDNHIPAGAKLY